MPLNQQPSRQPSTPFRGARRWLSARSVEGCGRGVLKGADCFPSSHLIFFFDHFDIQRQRENSNNRILQRRTPETQKTSRGRSSLRLLGSLSLSLLYSLLAYYAK